MQTLRIIAAFASIATFYGLPLSTHTVASPVHTNIAQPAVISPLQLPSIVGQQAPIEEASPCARALYYGQYYADLAHSSLPLSTRAIVAQASRNAWHTAASQCPMQATSAIVLAASYDAVAADYASQAKTGNAYRAFTQPAIEGFTVNQVAIQNQQKSTTTSAYASTRHTIPDAFITAQDQAGYLLTVLAARWDNADFSHAPHVQRNTVQELAQAYTSNAQTLVSSRILQMQQSSSQQTGSKQSGSQQSQQAQQTQANTADPRLGAYNAQLVLQSTGVRSATTSSSGSDATSVQSASSIIDPLLGLRTNIAAALVMDGAYQSLVSLQPENATTTTLPQAWIDALCAQLSTAFALGYPNATAALLTP